MSSLALSFTVYAAKRGLEKIYSRERRVLKRKKENREEKGTKKEAGLREKEREGDRVV